MVKTFQSILAPYLNSFLLEKTVFGYHYITETAFFYRFDHYLSESGCPSRELPREIVEKWIAKQPHESSRTHRARLTLTSQFARYLCHQGIRAYVPDSRMFPVIRLEFVPYIFTHEQIRNLIAAIDRLPFNPCSPERHLIMPEIFRLLYGCGLRIGEVLRLRVADVDLKQGILTILQGKFRKDRLVPIVPSLMLRLVHYAQYMKLTHPNTIFFPNPYGIAYNKGTIYQVYRRALHAAGIPHKGRGKGPRLHDLRHTFAVHCLQRWYRQGEDLNACLPLLVTYLGHQHLSGTQRYLRLTSSIFPDITERLEVFFQQHLTGGSSHETH